jgi:hypothetical protein
MDMDCRQPRGGKKLVVEDATKVESAIGKCKFVFPHGDGQAADKELEYA